MANVSVGADAYQDLARIRERIDFRADDFFDDNAQLRFDELLVELESESRGIFETLWGDETPLEETGRTDVKRTTGDAAIALVYPVNEVTKVERKVSVASDWKTLDADWYDVTEHRLVLARRPNTSLMRQRQQGNVLATDARRAEWRDIAEKIRVTYDRGFGTTPPADILSIQIQLIENLLRKRKASQTMSAASPEELAQTSETSMVVTEEIRNRISDVTSPSRATHSI